MRWALVLSVFLAAACDSRADLEGSSNSPFLKEADNERGLGGRVYVGTEDAASVAVRMEPSALYANDVRLAATKDPSWSTFTSPNGGYQFLNAPLRYDLTFARGTEVIAFRELAFRYVELSIGETSTPRAFRAKTRLVPQPAPKPGHAIAYFAKGTDVTAFRADPSRAEGEIEFRQFTTTATVFAVEYDAAKGIGFASSWGGIDLSLSANAVVDANVGLVPLNDPPKTFTVETEAPPGFTVDSVEVVVDFGVPQSAEVVAKVKSGATVTYNPIPFSRPLARARATRGDGAVSTSLATFVDPTPGRLLLKLPDAPSIVETPASAGGTVRASGKGVHEHILVPASGTGTSLRIVLAEGSSVLPDVTRLGLPAPSGRYLWTVARWSDLDVPDQLAGREVRQILANARTAPREIVFP